MIVPVITVDGPSGVGKGTLSQALAEQLNWHLLDSGAIYRLLALAALNHRIDLIDEQKLAEVAEQLDVEFISTNYGVKIKLESDDVTDLIRTEQVGSTASQIASLAKVRLALLARLRNFRQPPGLIADGRDMGTVVFPDAAVKIFLDASAEERARRRMNQLQEKGNYVRFDDLLSEIKARDDRDRNRTEAPLKPASDALLIDSTDLSIEQVIDKSLKYIKNYCF